MRQPVYPERIVFHASPSVAAELKAMAQRDGVTLSEVMRRAALREVNEAAT